MRYLYQLCDAHGTYLQFEKGIWDVKKLEFSEQVTLVIYCTGSHSYYSKLPQMQRFEASHIYLLTVMEVRDSMSLTSKIKESVELSSF